MVGLAFLSLRVNVLFVISELAHHGYYQHGIDSVHDRSCRHRDAVFSFVICHYNDLTAHSNEGELDEYPASLRARFRATDGQVDSPVVLVFAAGAVGVADSHVCVLGAK